jgi:Mg-chelatase subunit ChlD
MSAALAGCSKSSSPTPEGLGAATGLPHGGAGNGGNFAAGGGGGSAAGGGASAQGGTAPGGGVGGTVVISVEPGAAGDGAGGESGADSNGLDPDDACAAETHTGEQIPVDIFVMLDISGSMNVETASGTTKWQAVNSALRAFVESPDSEGLGVGIQYFPLRAPGVPEECTSNGQCGAFGPCLFNACENAAPALVACSADDDCAAGEGPCVELGTCLTSGGFCIGLGAQCSSNLADLCVPLLSSICLDANCSVDAYGDPAVPIAPLPKNGAALLASLDAQEPDGNTPTGPALQGAVDYAASYAADTPTHTVVVVFATDGLPTQCEPVDIPGIAEIASTARSGKPPISTYVIGVFGPEDTEAQSNLDDIATAGGTDSAFIVDTSRDVAEELTLALNTIRGVSLACEFQIPEPKGDDKLDYSRVNVKVADGASSSTDLYYVAKAADCDEKDGGWYYDADPERGGKPKKIVVCPATCDAFKASPEARVDISLGCKTIVPPPR